MKISYKSAKTTISLTGTQPIIMKQKKVIHALSEIKFSGAEVMLNLAASYFKECGVDPYILSVGAKVGDYAEVLAKAGYKIHHIPFSYSPTHFKKIYKFFKENEFDAVHIHFEGAFFWYATAIWLAGCASIVRTVHNVFQYKGYIRFRRILQRFITRAIYDVKFVSIGDSVATVERENLLNPTIYVPNWIDKGKYEPLKDEFERLEARHFLGLPQDAVVLTSVGASTEVKNQKDILTAMASIIKKGKKAYYLHVGDGPLQKDLKEYTEKLGIQNHVMLAGQRKNIRQVLIASDIYVMPSRFEGLSISCLEAMTCGLPSVVYNVYGLRDLIRDNENGFIVESHPAELEKALIKLIDNSSLRESMGKQARKMIMENYDMKKSIDKLLNIYFQDYKPLARELVKA